MASRSFWARVVKKEVQSILLHYMLHLPDFHLRKEGGEGGSIY